METYQSAAQTKWLEFQGRDVSEKLPAFSRNGRIYHCIYSQQFDRRFLDNLFDQTNIMRGLDKTEQGRDMMKGLLRHNSAMELFTQPSTRTFLSHAGACDKLGMTVFEIRDMDTSSQIKGETFQDTVKTFASDVDLLIMRHHEPNRAEQAAYVLNNHYRPIPVINGGSGADQHPTQALLDTYTFDRYLEGGVDGKKIAMVGDLKRGRTVRSLSYLMKNYKGVELIFISPEAFGMKPDIKEYLQRHGIPYKETDQFEDGIRDADAIYMTRIQDEQDKDGESQQVDYSPFHLKMKHMKMIKPSCIIMHPLPRRYEIEEDIDNDDRAKYWQQERNGLWVRTALISHIMGADDKVRNYADGIGETHKYIAECRQRKL